MAPFSCWDATGSSPIQTNASINPGFPILHGLYAVVRGDSVTIPEYLQPLLGNGSAGSGFVCGAGPTVVCQGFLNVGGACGTIFHF